MLTEYTTFKSFWFKVILLQYFRTIFETQSNILDTVCVLLIVVCFYMITQVAVVRPDSIGHFILMYV